MQQLSLFDLPIPVARPNPAHRATTAEVRAVRSDAEALAAAGWRRSPDDALGLTWTIPDLQRPGELYEMVFEDLEDLAVAAAFLRERPMTAPELLHALGLEVD